MRQAYLFVVIIFCLFFSACQKADVGLAPGQFAPDFELKDLLGKSQRLSDYRGKNVILNFWASWCVPCMQEASSLEKLSKLKPDQLVVIGVAVDDQPADIAKFINDYQLTFPVLLDSSAKVKAQYNLTGLPETFWVDREGKISLILDPDRQSLEAKISGSREWHRPAMSQQLIK